MLGDMPGVLPKTLRALEAALASTPRSLAAIPAFEAQWGNPVLVRAGLFDALSRLEGDSGARRLLERQGSRVSIVPVADPAVLCDIDTKGALASELLHAAREQPLVMPRSAT